MELSEQFMLLLIIGVPTFVALFIMQQEKQVHSIKMSEITRKPKTENSKDDDNSQSNYNFENYVKIISEDKKILERFAECLDIGSLCYKEEYVVNFEHTHSKNIFLTEIIIAVTSISFLSLVMRGKTKNIDEYAKDLAMGLAGGLVEKFLISMPDDLFLEYMDFRYDIYKEKLNSIPDIQNAIPEALDTINNLYSGDMGLVIFKDKTDEFFITKELWEKVPALRFKTNDEGYRETIKSLTQKCRSIEYRLHQILDNDNNNVTKSLVNTDTEPLYNKHWYSLLTEIQEMAKDITSATDITEEYVVYVEYTIIVELFYFIVTLICADATSCRNEKYAMDIVETGIKNLKLYIQDEHDNNRLKGFDHIAHRFEMYFYTHGIMGSQFADRIEVYSKYLIDLGSIRYSLDNSKTLKTLEKLRELYTYMLLCIKEDLVFIIRSNICEDKETSLRILCKLAGNSKMTYLGEKYAKNFDSLRG